MASEMKTWAMFSHARSPMLLALQAEIDHGRRAARKVDDHPRQGLVQGGVGVGEAGDAAAIAEGLIEGLAQRDRTIFGGVVIVDLEIALAAEVKIEAGVLGEADQHVIEKADAGLDVRLAFAIQGQTKLDIGL